MEDIQVDFKSPRNGVMSMKGLKSLESWHTTTTTLRHTKEGMGKTSWSLWTREVTQQHFRNEIFNEDVSEAVRWEATVQGRSQTPDAFSSFPCDSLQTEWLPSSCPLDHPRTIPPDTYDAHSPLPRCYENGREKRRTVNKLSRYWGK